ncbi:MAG: adenosylcobinamide-GDP ribazoletransferase [Candidatus Aquilonibacter sp.]
MNLLRALAASFSYFSILPIPHADEPPCDDAIGFLPIVGVVIGGLSGFGAYGIWLLTQNGIAATITAWVLSIALSGAIHVDGFLDCCDGLFVMASPRRRLEIMRDPHHGTYAFVGMVMLSALWLYALAQIPPMMMPVVLAITGYLGRAGGLIVAQTFVREGREEKVTVSRVATVITGGVIAGIIGAFGRARPMDVLVAALLAVPVSLVFGLFASRRLGGVVNGDCYGATIVVTEVALLLTYPALVQLR